MQSCWYSLQPHVQNFHSDLGKRKRCAFCGRTCGSEWACIKHQLVTHIIPSVAKQTIVTFRKPVAANEVPKDTIGAYPRTLGTVVEHFIPGLIIAESNFSAAAEGLCCDGERFSFVFFDVTTPSSLLRWKTVQSVGMGNGSVLSFSM